MIVSLNEIQTTCYRAALGVGLSHGLAEDASSIVTRLVAGGPGGLATMLRALTFADAHRVAAPVFALENGTYVARHAVLPALMAGPVVADLKCADPDAAIDLSLVDEPAVIEACLAAPPQALPAVAIEVPGGLWQALVALAARTYVPRSETSRLMGAGAGLRDND